MYEPFLGAGVAVSIVTDYGLDDRGLRQRIVLVSASRPALGPTQPPVQWVPGVLSPGVKRGRGVMLTTHPHLVRRLSMSRSFSPLPPCTSMECCGTALLFFFYEPFCFSFTKYN
jgi:hypothetical protein